MTGLLLDIVNEDKEAFEVFLSKWEEINGGFTVFNKTYDTEAAFADRTQFMDRITFTCDFELTALDGLKFNGCYFDNDMARSAFLTPILRHDNELNVPVISEDGLIDVNTVEKAYDEVGLFVIPTKYTLEGPKSFIDGNKRYESPQEIIDEFKESLGKYFPDDFDWNSHIGYIHVNF